MDKQNLCFSLSDIEKGLCFPSVQKLGILGGSFNPVHYGHLILGRTALKALEAQECKQCEQDRMPNECILFLPTGLPYHKENTDLLSFSARSEMLRLALQEENRKLAFEQDGLTKFFFSTMEGERSGNSYTYDSAVLLKKIFPYAELFLIIGTDEFYTLENWYKTEELGKVLKFLVANRNGEAEQKALEERTVFLKEEYGLQCTFLEMEKIECSSSLIRKRIKEKASIEGMLPEPVIEFIQKNRFYE